MKKTIFKWFIGIALVLIVGMLWMVLTRSAKIQFSWLAGDIATLKRGDLTIPITADGEIEPKDRVEIKSEAGGTVDETPFEVGKLVHAGDLLVTLDPEDEQRSFDIFTKALEQAGINLDRAKTSLYQAKEVSLPMAQARLDQTNSQLEYAEFEYGKTKKLEEEGQTHPDELRQVASQRDSLLAQKKQAEADLRRAESNIDLANLDVKQAELAVAKAKDDLADAQKRVKETRVVAPSDGMLSKLYARKGMVIVSGSRSLTGGTPLATLADISEFYVHTEVDEAEIGRVHDIAPVEARPGTYEKEPPKEPLAVASTPSEPTAEESDPPNVPPFSSGTPVKVTVEAFPDEVFEGTIDRIEPEPNKTAGIVTYIVRIRLTSPNSSKLFIGMHATVEFVSEKVNDAVLVPNEAVRYVGGQKGIYMQVESRKTPGKKVPQWKEFRAGLDNGQYTQVIDGLKEGDVVYTKLPHNHKGEEVAREEDMEE